MTLNLFRSLSVFAIFASCAITAAVGSRDSRLCEGSRYEHKPRVFVATDMGNEPDDQMSLVRFLTYANEFDVQGIVTSTSVWKNSSVDEPTVRKVISAYGNVTNNLNAHVPSYAPYPSAEELLAKVHSGHPVYGLAALELEPSNASLALVQAVDDTSSQESQWVLLWGGAVVLAEALNLVSKTRDAEAVATFVAKLRVYSISDQDDAGAWIRANYESLFYVVSLHGFSEYSMATWTGISGDMFYHFDQGGPDTSTVTNEWLEEHIRIGELGSHYPKFDFIMEGDTPTFLHLVQNGLGDSEHPEYGTWGGRYELLDASGRTRVFSDVGDWVTGVNGQKYMTRQGTIWRWRKDYQWDFANRMQWSTTSDYSQANHAPHVTINNLCGPEILTIPYRASNSSSSFVLDASASWDPDNDELEYNWIWYRDVSLSATGNSSAQDALISIQKLNALGSAVNVTLAPRRMSQANLSMHVVLAVTDIRNATTYQRVVLDPTID